jgi:hypothetical protein
MVRSDFRRETAAAVRRVNASKAFAFIEILLEPTGWSSENPR